MFDHFIDTMQSLKPKPPSLLYHYCGAHALKYFVHRDADIWCTHCNHLNDPEECWAGIRMFLAHLKRKAIVSSEVYANIEANMRKNSLWNKIFAKDGHSKIMPFTFSFSEIENDEKMWVYAGDSGYRLTFDADAVEQNVGRVHSILSALDPYNRMTLSLWPCFYEESDAVAIERLFDAVCQDMKPQLDKMQTSIGDRDAREVLSAITTISPVFKSEKWGYEKEWRLVMFRENFDRVQFVNHRARSYLSSSPYGLRSLIKHITPNPKGNVDWGLKYLAYEINDGFRNPVSEFID